MTSSSSYVGVGRRTLEGSIRIFLAEALVLPTGLIVAIFLTRRLGPADYGLFTLAVTLVSWVEWGITAILARATLKFVGEAEDWRPVGGTVARVHLAIGVFSFVLVWLLAPRIAVLLGEPIIARYLRLFAFDIPLFSLASAHRQILVGIGNFGQRALATAGRWVARLLIIVLLVELGLSVQGAILGSIGASLVDLLIARFYVRPALFSRSTFPFRQLLAYAVPLFLSALSLRFFDRLDLFALKVLGGTAEQAGIYGAMQSVSVVPGIIAVAVSPLILAVLSRAIRAGDSHTVRRLTRDGMRMVIALVPFAAMTAGAAPEIVSLIFGPRFLPGSPVLAILIFAALAGIMLSVTTAILIAADKPSWTLALAGPLVPLAAVGHVLFIPRFGPVGAAFVTTLSANLGAVAGILAVHSIVRTLPPAATLGRSVLVAGCAYILASVWHTPGSMLLLKLPAMVVGILGALLLLGEFSATELAMARDLLKWRTAFGHRVREI